MYLVTGGAGFIGSHTCALLLKQGHRVRVLDDLSAGSLDNLRGLDLEFIQGKIEEEDCVRRAVRGCSHIIHLAALPGVPASCADPIGFDRVNIHGTLQVLEAARQEGAQRVVYASSCAVYGDQGLGRRREDDPLLPESPYAAAKAANELYAQVYTRSLGLETVGLRYFNVYGPRQDPRGPYAAVTPRFVERAIAQKPLIIFGDGHQSRDFVSVHDVAEANLAASTAPAASGQVFNIGTGRAITVLELARQVQDGLGEVGLEHQPERPGEIRQMCADAERAQKTLSWRAGRDPGEALQETISWYRQLTEASR